MTMIVYSLITVKLMRVEQHRLCIALHVFCDSVNAVNVIFGSDNIH